MSFKKVMYKISWMYMISALVMLSYIACVSFVNPKEATWKIQVDLFIFVMGAVMNLLFERMNQNDNGESDSL